NLEPVAEKDGDGKETLRWPKQGEFTPMLLAVARPDYAKMAFDKVKTLMDETVGASKESEYSEEDLEFFDELPVDAQKAFWQSPETQEQLKRHVILQEPGVPVDPMTNPASQPAPTTGFPTSTHQRRAPVFTVDPDIDDVFESGELKKGV